MTIECSLTAKDKWIEMFPYGFTMGVEGSRPVLIFKDKTERRVLPVWISSLDAGIAVTQSQARKVASSPHQLTHKILELCERKIEKCFFTRVSGHHQFVELHFSSKKGVEKIESRAEDAMSFCLSSNIEFYCKLDFIEDCRVMDVEMNQTSHARRFDSDKVRSPYLN